ncbi:hypothetical protein M0R45_014768 [Rubus argutus]|uniref:Uncharacterized protein n=1 Tax=Rubus argutus TaxID=59490 RepID=A0AAW1XPA0_RUBAR
MVVIAVSNSWAGPKNLGRIRNSGGNKLGQVMMRALGVIESRSVIGSRREESGMGPREGEKKRTLDGGEGCATDTTHLPLCTHIFSAHHHRRLSLTAAANRATIIASGHHRSPPLRCPRSQFTTSPITFNSSNPSSPNFGQAVAAPLEPSGSPASCLQLSTHHHHRHLSSNPGGTSATVGLHLHSRR